jgi:alpha-beta hydrolase superfamily lysophospholipase
MKRIEFTRTAPDGQELYYQGWAPEAQPKAVVCLVHGLGEHTGRYAHVGAALNDAGYALFGFDGRGHGKTPGPRGVTPKFDRSLDDIGLLLEEAATRYPGKPRFLYGHSMGGDLVLNYALQRKPSIAGVVATSPFLRPGFKPPASKLVAGRVLYRLAPNTVMPNGLELAGLARDPAVIEAYKSDPLVHDRMSARLGLDLLRQGEWALAHASEFPPIPLLIVHGTGDRLTSAPASEEFADTVIQAAQAGTCGCQCTLKLWPGYYHETHNEPEKEQVLCYMIDWLDGIKE